MIRPILTRILLTACWLIASLAVARAADSRHIVFMIGEDEYHTAETLPDFAAKDLKPRGYRITIIQADAAEKNNFPGLIAALRDADLLFLSVRRRTPPPEQLDAIRAHLAAGKALIGIRTASHAFALRDKQKLTDPKLSVWQDFDSEVLGGNYSNHYKGNQTASISFATGAESHPILRGVPAAKLAGHGSLYKVSPLREGAKPLLIGAIVGEAPEPVAWTRLYGPRSARIFYTSLGHPDDFQSADFRRLLLNSIAWTLDR
jgi:type 1 glutamine amidotransferase